MLWKRRAEPIAADVELVQVLPSQTLGYLAFETVAVEVENSDISEVGEDLRQGAFNVGAVEIDTGDGTDVWVVGRPGTGNPIVLAD
jgi:hypothetical protein